MSLVKNAIIFVLFVKIIIVVTLVIKDIIQKTKNYVSNAIKIVLHAFHHNNALSKMKFYKNIFFRCRENRVEFMIRKTCQCI